VSYPSSHASSSDLGFVASIATHHFIQQAIQNFGIAVIGANKIEKRTSQNIFNDWSPFGIPQLDISAY